MNEQRDAPTSDDEPTDPDPPDADAGAGSDPGDAEPDADSAGATPDPDHPAKDGHSPEPPGHSFWAASLAGCWLPIVAVLGLFFGITAFNSLLGLADGATTGSFRAKLFWGLPIELEEAHRLAFVVAVAAAAGALGVFVYKIRQMVTDDEITDEDATALIAKITGG